MTILANSMSGEDYLVLWPACFLNMSSQGGGGRQDGFPEVSFIRILTPFSWPNHGLKALPLNTIYCGIRGKILLHELEEGTNITPRLNPSSVKPALWIVIAVSRVNGTWLDACQLVFQWNFQRKSCRILGVSLSMPLSGATRAESRKLSPWPSCLRAYLQGTLVWET